MEAYNGFPHILLLSGHFFTGVLCNCLPLEYASFGAKLLKIRWNVNKITLKGPMEPPLGTNGMVYVKYKNHWTM